jgi:parallel beta-helix repeat protein
MILNNIVKNSQNGIYFSNSNNNHLENNTIKDCSFTGIYLLYSKNNILKQNEMTNCGLLVYGSNPSDYINNVDSTNKVNAKPLYYLINENDIIIPSDAGEVILVNCENCNVNDLELCDGTIGIELVYSNNNIILKNTLKNNKYSGIYIESSNSNTIISNNIENNGYGISMQLANFNNIKLNNIFENIYGLYIYLSDTNNYSTNNIYYNNYGMYFSKPSNNNNIFFNNIYENGINALDKNDMTNIWDNGKKGNYWGDYTLLYPKAEKMWIKGIWNTPYDIPDRENQDRYPKILPTLLSREKLINFLPIFKFESIKIFTILKEILQIYLK